MKKITLLERQVVISFGGRIVLIHNVFPSVSTHLLYEVNPPKGARSLIYKIFTIFWNNYQESRIKHWVK